MCGERLGHTFDESWRPNQRRTAMTQIAQPQVSTVSGLRARRTVALSLLGALVVLMTALILVIGNGGGGSGTSIQTVSPRSVGFEAGPAAGTPAAVSQAFGIERVPSGISLTTNVPAPPRVDEGPVAGTPAAVSAATHGSSATHPGLPSSLTTNVPAKAVVQGRMYASGALERQLAQVKATHGASVRSQTSGAPVTTPQTAGQRP
jgi:hypothetical protein